MSKPNKKIRVNKEWLPESLIDQEIAFLYNRYAIAIDEAELVKNKDAIISDAVENAIERLLLIQKARSVIPSLEPEEMAAHRMAIQKQVNTENEQTSLTELEDNLRVEKFFEQLFEFITPPEACDAKVYYEENLELFKSIASNGISTTIKPFDEVRQDILEMLAHERKNEVINKEVDKLLSTAVIER